MSEDESYIVKAPDPARIVEFQDRDALSQFLKDPQSAIAGALIETFSHGPSAWTGPLVRVAVASLTGRALQQFAQEIKYLQDKGKLANDWAEKPKGYQTWVELLRVIDEESPDDERLGALKAMFFAVNKINASDAEQIVAYELFQIAKKLNSNDLIVLKRLNELRLNTSMSSNTHQEWVQIISANSGNLLKGLIELAEANLMKYRLLSGPPSEAPSVNRPRVDPTNLRLTDLGLKFCENVQRYEIDKKS